MEQYKSEAPGGLWISFVRRTVLQRPIMSRKSLNFLFYAAFISIETHFLLIERYLISILFEMIPIKYIQRLFARSFQPTSAHSCFPGFNEFWSSWFICVTIAQALCSTKTYTAALKYLIIAVHGLFNYSRHQIQSVMVRPRKVHPNKYFKRNWHCNGAFNFSKLRCSSSSLQLSSITFKLNSSIQRHINHSKKNDSLWGKHGKDHIQCKYLNENRSQ